MIFRVIPLGLLNKVIFMICVVVGMLHQLATLNILNYSLFLVRIGEQIKKIVLCNVLLVQHFLHKKICRRFYSNVKMQFNLIIVDSEKSSTFFHFMKKVL